MKSLFLPIPILLLTYLLTIGSPAWAIPHKEVEITPEPEPFDLYFSDEKFVEVASRYPKALSSIAENVTTITAAEIEAANVHTIAEILNRVAGMFVSFNGHDFGSDAALLIHGVTAANHHTLVLLDGVKYNRIANGAVTTNDIPVSIIKRIEIVKGPASSAWGSALGGVVNIITKDVGKNRLHGGVSSTIGEAGSSDIGGEGYGTIKNIGYYLYAGRQESEGLRDNRFFRNENFYGKLKVSLPHKSEFMVTTGYTQPEIKYFDYYPIDLSAQSAAENFFVTANFNRNLADNLDLCISFNTMSRKDIQDYSVLGVGIYGSVGDQFQRYQWDENSSGFEGRLVWSREYQTIAFGLDYSRNELEQRIINGPYMQGLGLPSEVEADSASEERWAAYVNDTIEAGNITITPGLRYDWHSIADDFLSPSIGVVYKYREDVLFRGSIAKGLSSPYLELISGGGDMFLTINPELKPEQVWSFQVGYETASLKFCRFKTTLFFHNLHDAWKQDSATGEIINGGKNKRSGYEIELDTIPIRNFSFSTNMTSIYERSFSGEDDHYYNVNIGLRYDHPQTFRAELFGHYVWWPALQSNNGQYDDFLWDYSMSKKISMKNQIDLKLFCTIHNIFNGSQYWGEQVVNPDRWVEFGLSFSF